MIGLICLTAITILITRSLLPQPDQVADIKHSLSDESPTTADHESHESKENALTPNSAGDRSFSNLIEVPSSPDWPAPNARTRMTMFSKFGGSSVKSHAFLHCLGDLSATEIHDAEVGESLKIFQQTAVSGRNSFERESLAAAVGWSLANLMLGRPNNGVKELKAIRPRYVLLFFGGNDVQGKRPHLFARRLWKVIDQIQSFGSVPILGSVFPREDSEEMDNWATEYNKVSAGLARALGLLYVDFYRAANGLPNRGVARDGVHPNVYSKKRKRAPCFFRRAGLAYGQNVRNLMTLHALDRVRKLDQKHGYWLLKQENKETQDANAAMVVSDEPGASVEKLPFAKKISPGQVKKITLPKTCSEHTQNLRGVSHHFDVDTEVEVHAFSFMHAKHFPPLLIAGEDTCMRSDPKSKHGVKAALKPGSYTLWTLAPSDDALRNEPFIVSVDQR